MAAAIVIRRLERSELAAYKQLRETMLRGHPDAFSSDAGEAEALAPDAYLGRLGLDRPEGGVFTLAAWAGADLAGAVSCERDRRLKVRHIVHLTAMMVRPDHAGRGIGRALLVAALDACRDAEGVVQVTLSVTAHNATAVRLYERAGFVRYASLERALRIGDRYVTKDQMVRVL